MEDGQQSSSFAQIFEVLLSPTKTFEQLARKPSWVLPFIISIILGLVLTAVVVPMIDWGEVIRAQVEATGQNVPAEQLDQQIEFMQKFGSVIAWVSTLVMPLILYPVMTLIFWVAFKVMGSAMTFKQGLSVLLHGFTPYWLVSSVLSIPVVLAQGEVTTEQVQNSSYLMSNLAFLATEDTSPAVASLLGSMDLFTFWTLALLTIGFRIVARVSTTKAAAIPVGLWLIYVLGKAGLTMVF